MFMDDIASLNEAKGLKIVQLNCRSIYGKIDEINCLYKDVDILSCSETWLTDKITDHMVSILNMEIFRWDRQNGLRNGVRKSKGGGVACYINNKLGLDCRIMSDLTFTNSDIELLTLQCVHTFGKKVYIMTLYRPPDGSIKNFFEILNKLLDDNPLLNSEFWLMGDFNIDFLKRQDMKTKTLHEFLRVNGLRQHITLPTRLSGFGKSCIDFIISNIDESLIVSSGTLNDVVSDHLPVYICIKKSRNKPEFTKTKGRTYKNYDKPLLQNLLRIEDWVPFYQLTDPSELWDFIVSIIKKHLDVMCPLKYIRVRTDSPPWINQDVIELINDRNISYRKARTSGCLDDLRNARLLRNRTNVFIRNSKASYIKETLNRHKNDPKKFWRTLNETLLKGKSDCSHITFDRGDGQYTGISEASEYINNHFANIGSRLYNQFKDSVSIDSFSELYNLPTADDETELTVENILSAVRSINIHKSSGIEFMPTFILKDCFEILALQITYMFNQSMLLGIFPKSWAIATITPIPKNGNKSFVNNWRPISIIPLVGKLLEKLCVKLLNNHLDINNILCDEQYGFRPKRSTILAIFTFVKKVTEEINQRKLVGAIYLDFAKAFDSVNHPILLEKLKNMGISKRLLNWIKSYLEHRKICTKLNNNVSTPKELLCGVPQGSILGPALFLCYINDLAIKIKGAGAYIGLFADDTVIYYSNYDQFFVKLRLERVLSEINDWCTLNCINMNVDKTKFCLYGSRKMVNTFRDNTIGSMECQISQCHQYNYLGVTLDECLNMQSNFNAIFKKFSYKNYQFSKICKYLDTSTHILVYKQTVLPLVEYVSFILCFNNKQDIEKLQRLQNRSLRLCYNIHVPNAISTVELHRNANIKKLDDRRELALLYIMFDMYQKKLYKKTCNRQTRAADGYIFDLTIPHSGVYAKSPYYVGASLWNDLPMTTRNMNTKGQFKRELKDRLR